MLTQTKQTVPEDNQIVSKIDRMPEPTAFKIEIAKKSKEGNGYEAALVNFRFIANTVWTTEEAVQKINDSK